MEPNKLFRQLVVKLNSLEKIDVDVFLFKRENRKNQVGKWVMLIGAAIIFFVNFRLLPEKVDSILHHEILFLGELICFLGMVIFNKLLAYFLFSFLIIAQTLWIFYYYFAYHV